SRAVLDQDLEAARGGEPLYRGRRDHEVARLVDLGEAVPERRDQLVRRRAVAALLERLRADEDGAGVGAVGARRPGEAGELNRVLDAWGRQDDLAGTTHDRVGPGQRRAVGKLDGDDEVPLVLRRD